MHVMDGGGLAEEMLAEAYELVLSGWCQGAAARDEYGEPVGPASVVARKWSAPGALERVWERRDDRYEDALDAYEEASLALAGVVHGLPQAWNDAPDRSQWEVLDAIERAAHRVKPTASVVDGSPRGA